MNLARTRNITTLLVACLLTFVVGCDDTEKLEGKMPQVLAVDQLAPDFEFHLISNTEGSVEKFSQFRGKVIYLDFWASWCLPCTKSMPLFDQLRSEFKANGFEVVAVNLDANAEKGIEFLKLHPVSYPVVRAVDNRISDIFQINGLPTSYIIDRQGRLRYVHQGFKVEDLSEIKEQILSLLKSENNGMDI